MVSYLKSVVKHASDIPYIASKFYSNIVVPSSVYLAEFCTELNIGVVEEDFMLL
jgi:hypothetical protein